MEFGVFESGETSQRLVSQLDEDEIFAVSYYEIEYSAADIVIYVDRQIVLRGQLHPNRVHYGVKEGVLFFCADLVFDRSQILSISGSTAAFINVEWAQQFELKVGL